MHFPTALLASALALASAAVAAPFGGPRGPAADVAAVGPRNDADIQNLCADTGSYGDQPCAPNWWQPGYNDNGDYNDGSGYGHDEKYGYGDEDCDDDKDGYDDKDYYDEKTY